ncbi:MAG: hypothetical protein IKW91_11105, partial [Bacteroidaceae bacterium]|nr:hypothetical protein [Bacteroidaceae bacterium]
AWKVSDLPVTYDENSAENEIVPRTYYNKVVLNKTFVNDEWQFVCFPFSLNAADIETIFGKGTQVAPFPNSSPEEGGLQAGKPYRICSTDVLPSPIVLENVRIETDTPQSLPLGGEEGGFITGTFQKTDEATAFSAIITEDPDGLKDLKDTKDLKDLEASWYDLSGKSASLLLKGVRGSGAILVTKGRKEIR